MLNKVEFQFQSPRDSPGFLLSQLSTLWHRKQKKILDPLDLTHTQFVLMATLAWLSKSSEQVTQIDIAGESNTDRMMVSKVLRTLENKGFITRVPHKSDTRAKVVRLTSSGTKVVQKALEKVESSDIAFFEYLKADLKRFNGNLWKLIAKNQDEFKL
ncbi:UNVERIFIED_CONTAM: hypothetical protein GTU68_035766 [Idotea baltica]|nr:hypothetical protein [Idotea baltica]